MKGLYTGVGGKTNFHEDIHASCIREVKEETGLTVPDVKLKAVVKTILEEKQYSWILFVYTANQFSGDLIKCNEGDISWVAIDNIYNKNLMGPIRKILPHILKGRKVLETTIKYDKYGNVLEDSMGVTQECLTSHVQYQ